ncbi:hypothetical protein ETB97_001230 [Aspergillus alliaceus]|uniref:APS kinase domain-containing protein n=1 Tax=Petromyces alliaceus TaxID=209559 RepID=A0A8H6A141_PETAA|nr:hypothetical protein ETB97_001230 [Aspergillus burnettii]
MGIQVILVSGRSGVGKTSVANEISEQLRNRNSPHAHIDGDNLDMICPEEEGSDLMLSNLAAMWGNYYSKRGCKKLILSGTAMVLEHEVIRETLERVMRDSTQPTSPDDATVDIKGFILTSPDDVIKDRLKRREIGSLLEQHLHRSQKMAAVLENEVNDWACCVPTDGRTVQDIAMEVLVRAQWR